MTELTADATLHQCLYPVHMEQIEHHFIRLAGCVMDQLTGPMSEDALDIFEVYFLP